MKTLIKKIESILTTDLDISTLDTSRAHESAQVHTSISIYFTFESEYDRDSSPRFIQFCIAPKSEWTKIDQAGGHQKITPESTIEDIIDDCLEAHGKDGWDRFFIYA